MKENIKEFKVLEGESYKNVIHFLLSLKKKVFLLEGSVGLGKTTFTSEFIKEIAINKKINFDDLGVMSPTYSIVNEYFINGNVIFHADFYRIKENPLELEEVLESIEESEYSFVEWNEKIPGLRESLDEYVKVCFSFLDDGSRQVKTLSC